MRRLVPGSLNADIRRVWVSDNFTGAGTYADPIDVAAGEGGGSSGNVDGGQPDSVYGGAVLVDGGAP
jgi:hypothetical protein